MNIPPKSYLLYHLLWTGLDWVFPPICGGCGRPGSRWCADCHVKVQRPVDPICEMCGIPLGRKSRLCTDCQNAPPRFRALRSWSTFDSPVKDALRRLKYHRDISLGDALATQIIGFARDLNWPVDLIIPVPLGKSRLRERGYNQASLIARPLSLALGTSYSPKALVRVRETNSQVGLSRVERRANVRAAFEAFERSVKDHIILLIDDVATTGSTLSSCADALFTAHARDVFALAVARALPHHGWQDA